VTGTPRKESGRTATRGLSDTARAGARMWVGDGGRGGVGTVVQVHRVG